MRNISYEKREIKGEINCHPETGKYNGQSKDLSMHLSLDCRSLLVKSQEDGITEKIKVNPRGTDNPPCGGKVLITLLLYKSIIPSVQTTCIISENSCHW